MAESTTDATKSTPRYDFYQTGDGSKLILTIFETGYNPDGVKIQFRPRSLSYENEDSLLVLEPLRGQIKPDECSFRIVKLMSGKKSKVELTLVKESTVHWDTLEGDAPDAPTVLSTFPTDTTPAGAAENKPKKHKDWDGITSEILSKDKSKSSTEDPNAGGDIATNEFFQQLYSNADDDTRRAIIKSYQESNGTVLSTNWSEVGKGKVETKPPSGQEAKKW
ncbi:SGS-domain-containing protein [Schizopora paradoxa]|uniref:SGS-domain-containing protein n=1 Tax=Schizopora paradoxa TaxID=27342 RepID=A0A0H2RZI3_9AGAM|nr:SGS-domain-containing protein [Schizopora paradoxa]